MSVCPAPLVNCLKRSVQACLIRLVHDHPVTLPVASPIERKAKEVERSLISTFLRHFAKPPWRSGELHKTSFLWTECQSVFAKSFRQYVEHLPRVCLIREYTDDVVCVAHHEGLPMKSRPDG